MHVIRGPLFQYHDQEVFLIEQGNACKCTHKKHHIEIIKTKVRNDEFYEFVMTTIPSLYKEQPQLKLRTWKGDVRNYAIDCSRCLLFIIANGKMTCVHC